MDKLEEYIRKNREELDRYTPPSGIWKKISTGLGKGRQPVTKWAAIAAMLVIILGTAVIFYTKGSRLEKGSNNISENEKEQITNPQLKETEIYYNNLINSLYREATPLLTANPEIQKELTTDISQLDSICSDIKNDLKDNVDNQEVVEALIQNYRIKIHLLEDMLKILKEDENNLEKPKKYDL